MRIKTKGFFRVGQSTIPMPVPTQRENLKKMKQYLRNPSLLKREKTEGRVWW